MKDTIPRPAASCCPVVCEPLSGDLEVEDAPRLARVFKALGDETRLAIVAMLGRTDCARCACEIESNFNLSQPTISHHLKVLRDAGLVETERRGTWVYYSLQRETLALAVRFIQAPKR